MRPTVVAALAFGLGACAVSGDSAPPASEWKIERRADHVSEKPQFTVAVFTRSRNAKAEIDARGSPQFASLQLMCFDNAPIVRFQFTHGVGSNRNSRLAYRFDQNPGRDVPARILQDFRTIVIEDKYHVGRFADELRGASILVVQVSSLTAGLSQAEFKVSGAPVAIDAAYVGCPLPGVQKPRVS